MHNNSQAQPSSKFAGFSWWIVCYTILVILFGAFVRATGSGAGCGDHWPLCNGTIMPRPERIETMIEFTHRLTSGLLLVFVVAAVIWAFRKSPKGHAMRHASMLSFIFVMIEAAIGAGLVLLQLVEDNSTPLRAMAVGLHLFNTFLLLAVMTYCAWYASRGYPERFKIRSQAVTTFPILLGLFLYGLVGAAGAITALGDTLFPVETVREGLSAAADGTSHFLMRLRVIHPMLAVLVSFYIIWLAGQMRQRITDDQVDTSNRAANPYLVPVTWALQGTVIFQLAAGVLNIMLKAPVWMQLLHLLTADIILVLFVIVSLEALRKREKAPA